MKQHSRDCIKCWRKGYHQSILKHMDVNTHNIFIMIWVDDFQEMVHFSIINWFNWIGVWIWNRFRVQFNWKLWRVKLNTTIINGMMIKPPYDIWNHRASVGRRGPVFGVIFWRLNVTLSWCFIRLITMKGVELIHIYSKNWWEEIRDTDDAGIRIVSNTSTSL